MGEYTCRCVRCPLPYNSPLTFIVMCSHVVVTCMYVCPYLHVLHPCLSIHYIWQVLGWYNIAEDWDLHVSAVSVMSMSIYTRNPEPHLRPSFDTVFNALRRPEELLLHWTEEDMAAGRHLLRATHTTHSFSDLQNKYTVQ